MRWFAVLLVATLASPAGAQDRALCPDRPGLGTPPCTVSPGNVLVETALGDWTRDEDDTTRTDTILIGDTLLRIGLTDRIEAQIGWTPFGHERVRGGGGGGVRVRDRSGDVLLGAKINLAHPDGSGFSIAVQPGVTLPVGRAPIGAGDWSAAVALPVAFDLTDTLSLQATPAIEAVVDEDRHGRHLAYGSVIGLALAVTDAIDATIELQMTRDDDPSGAATQALAGASLAWRPDKRLQLDIGGAIGLNRDSPDARLYAGIARLF